MLLDVSQEKGLGRKKGQVMFPAGVDLLSHELREHRLDCVADCMLRCKASCNPVSLSRLWATQGWMVGHGPPRKSSSCLASWLAQRASKKLE